MADTHVVTTHTGYGSRIMQSTKGIVGSVVIFFGSFALLYWNEGRIDLSTIARKAVSVEATALSSSDAPEASLVAASGTLTAPSPLGDGFALNPGPYVAVFRKAEMYAWVEKSSSSTKKNVGGSEDTTMTYTYTREWTSVPRQTSDFAQPAGHENPPFDRESLEARVYAPDATVGPVPVNLEKADLRGSSELPLSADTITLPEGYALGGSFLFKGAGTLQAPKVGDVRLSYSVVKSGMDVTAFGARTGSSLTPFIDEKTGESLYLLYPGTKAEAVKALHDEYTFWTWIWRVVGFLLMWSGLQGVLAVVSVLLDVLPFLGSISRAALGLVTFVIAFALSIVTILVSMLIHSPIALAIAAAAVLGGAWWWLKRKKPAQPAAPAPGVS